MYTVSSIISSAVVFYCLVCTYTYVDISVTYSLAATFVKCMLVFHANIPALRECYYCELHSSLPRLESVVKCKYVYCANRWWNMRLAMHFCEHGTYGGTIYI